MRLSKLLERYRFVAVSREGLGGRCAIAFDFTALPGDFALERDALLRRLAGRLWIDEEERAVRRVELRNTSRIRLGAFASVSSLSLKLEFTRLPDGVWLPLRVESLAVGRRFLVSGFRVRTITSYGRYRAGRGARNAGQTGASRSRLPNELW